MHFRRSRGSILHKLSKNLFSGKSNYGSRETELYSGARRMFRESRMRLQTIHYINATKGEITGMIPPAMVIVSPRSRPCSLQTRLARFSLLPKHVVIGKATQGLSFSSHSISPPYYLSEDSSKQNS